jgi:hypothetical protein
MQYLSSNVDLRVVKAAAKQQFGDIQGVEGFGIGDQRLRIYVRNSSVRHSLPDQFNGVPVEIVVTGEISALPR